MIGARLIGFLLVAEGVSTVVWLTQLLPTLSWRTGSSVALVVVRAIAGAMQVTSGWWLSTHRPAAVALARAALMLSAVLTTLELGARLAPSNLDPTFRWPLVAAYWMYALAAAWFLSRQPGRAGPPGG